MINLFKKYFLLIIICSAISLTGCSKEDNGGPKEPEQPEYPETGFKTLDYLYRIAGKSTISGIHNREPNSKPAQWTERIKTETGKYPALWSGDFLFQEENINDRQTMIDEALNQWKKGAMINIMWHACNPALSEPCGWDDQGVLSSMTNEQWKDLLTDGTEINTRWKSMMDDIAGYLQFLKDEGVEVLWRPLHEMNQGQFWWGGRPGENGTRKLYQLTHDYLTNEKGLTNLIWIWDVQDFGSLSTDVNTYNPGEDYWDVLALDIYDGSGFTTEKYAAILKAAKGKPIAIGECQTLPTTAILRSQSMWTFFMSWSELTFEHNTTDQIKALYNGSSIITLDDMPGWQ